MALALVIRCDATRDIGAGHLMRCLALAEAWRLAGGGAVTFLCAQHLDRLAARIRSAGFDIQQVSQSGGVVVPPGTAWVVADGYHLTATDHRALKASGAPLLVIDDGGGQPLSEADLLLNQNLFAQKESYAKLLRTDARCLVGPQYALLRQDLVRAIKGPRDHNGQLRHLLLLLGGTDALGKTSSIAKAMSRATPSEGRLTVVLGPGAPDSAAAGSVNDPLIEVRRDPADLPALLASADLAVSRSGVTLLELAALGTPVLAVSGIATEAKAAAAAEQMGFAHDLGALASLDLNDLTHAIDDIRARPPVLTAMSAAGQAAVDGQGAVRVVAAMIDKTVDR